MLTYHARSIFDAGVAAAAPEKAVSRHVARRGDELVVGGIEYDLRDYRSVLVVGAGKAAAAMAASLEAIIGDRITGGVVAVKTGHGCPLDRIRVLESGHPEPDRRSLGAAAELLNAAGGAGARDLVLALVSGGGSSLVAAPAPGITLTEKRETIKRLMDAGAPIDELNLVRRHLSAIKGGRLADAVYPARLITLLISDVPGDDPATVASGLTVPGKGGFAEALAVLHRRGLEAAVADDVRRRLRQGAAGELEEERRSVDPAGDRSQVLVIARNADAREGAAAQARVFGYRVRDLPAALVGEARLAGAGMAGEIRRLSRRAANDEPPDCLVAGGETTVTMTGARGCGGRNQEAALSAALVLDGCTGVAVLCAGTDGTDGPTDAAGAVADGTTILRARSEGMVPERHLERHDAYPLFDRLGDLVRTGPTRTNVMDIAVALSVPGAD